MSRIGKFIEMESTLVVARDKEEEMGNNSLMGTGFHGRVMKMFWN